MAGLRPVVDIMFGDFDADHGPDGNQQPAYRMSGGHWRVPMRCATLGATRRSAAQHRKSLHAWFSHVPGIESFLPLHAV
jgi:pyruvate dehydrogenase E1 component beta subunit